jgi:putative ABC transport system permease protein
MLKNYFRIAFRSLMKNKLFSFINIAGLAIGTAACLLILQYVSFELSFDQFHKNAKDIYRVYNDRYQNGKLIQHGTITYSAVGKAMQDDYPEIINHTRVEPLDPRTIIFNEQRIAEQNGIAVDNTFLSMFSYPMVTGNRESALQEPNEIILSESLAKKIFHVTNGDYEAIVGKAVSLGLDSVPYKITAVCKDVPENSHLHFDYLLSYSSLYSGGNGGWKEADYDFTDSDFWHYIQLRPGSDYKALQAKFPAFSQRHFQGNKVSGSEERFYLQPLLKAHLYSDFEYEIGDTASATVVWGLLIIAVLIIGIAWINYINLSTAKSMERAKEVGIRKVVGAARKELIRQFLLESVVINLIAVFIAVLLVFLAQSSFNHLIHHDLSVFYLFQKGLNGYSITVALVILLVAGIFISGFYPAFVLSSFKPILVLKGKYTASSKGIALRKLLVVGQFAVTVALIIGAFVVYRQIRFVSSQNLGFNMSQILIVKPPILTAWDSTFIQKENSFTSELKKLPHVKGAATSGRVPGIELGRAFNLHRTDMNTQDKFTIRNLGADQDFINLYGIKLLAGRNFSVTDYNYHFQKLHNVILTESAVKLLGFTSNNDALGKTISFFNKNWDVIGVINDFHQKSLHYPIEPTVLLPSYAGSSNPISVKVDTKELPQTIASIKKVFASFFKGNVFDYYFLDESFNKQYANDELFGKVFLIFSGFAIFIAALGLLGLSLFATEQRTKEIGIRKVLGATVSGIVGLLSKDFLQLVLIALLVASPIAWYFMNKWLENFAYRISISWWVFVVAGLFAIVIAVATISFQTIRAALANPVKSLRTE